MAEQKKPLRRGRKPAEGDKRKFLATMDPEIIKALKLAAIEDDTSASEALEEAAAQWLERRKGSRRI
jgi:Ribbon-helix-helix protein, copG family